MVVDRENGKVEKQKKREKRLKVKRGVRNANGEGIFWMPSGCLLDGSVQSNCSRFQALLLASTETQKKILNHRKRCIIRTLVDKVVFH